MKEDQSINTQQRRRASEASPNRESAQSLLIQKVLMCPVQKIIAKKVGTHTDMSNSTTTAVEYSTEAIGCNRYTSVRHMRMQDARARRTVQESSVVAFCVHRTRVAKNELW